VVVLRQLGRRLRTPCSYTTGRVDLPDLAICPLPVLFVHRSSWHRGRTHHLAAPWRTFQPRGSRPPRLRHLCSHVLISNNLADFQHQEPQKGRHAFDPANTGVAPGHASRARGSTVSATRILLGTGHLAELQRNKLRKCPYSRPNPSGRSTCEQVLRSIPIRPSYLVASQTIRI
jgi:hypothetical protein